MAELGWLLYLADVVGALDFILSAGCILTLAGVGGYKLAGFVEEVDTRPVRNYLIVAGALAFTAALIPSKTTIYAVVALHAGDRVLATETGNKSVQALNAWLEKQIADSDEEDSK